MERERERRTLEEDDEGVTAAGEVTAEEEERASERERERERELDRERGGLGEEEDAQVFKIP